MDKKAKHLFYVLECNDGSYYAGYTNDLERRVRVHNEGKGAKYTRAKRLSVVFIMKAMKQNVKRCRRNIRFKQLKRDAKERYIGKGRDVDEVTKKC